MAIEPLQKRLEAQNAAHPSWQFFHFLQRRQSFSVLTIFPVTSVFTISSELLILRQEVVNHFHSVHTRFRMRSLILSIFLLAVQALAYVSRLPQARTARTCNTPPPSVEILQAHRKMRLQPRDVPQGSIQVTAYFHVVRSPEREKWVTPDMISNQVCTFPTGLICPCSFHPDSCLEPGLRASWDHFSCYQN